MLVPRPGPVQLRGLLGWIADQLEAGVHDAGLAGYRAYPGSDAPGDAAELRTLLYLVNPAGWTKRQLRSYAGSGRLVVQCTHVGRTSADTAHVADLARAYLTNLPVPVQLPLLDGEGLSNTWVRFIESDGPPQGPTAEGTLTNINEDFTVFVAST